MKSRVVAGAVGAAFAMLVLVGCQPQPAPSPSTPTFATEEEAFAAAEETYRAYVDALNQVDLSDPETFEPVYEWTIGELNASERESLTQMHADGWTKRGQSEVVFFERRASDTSTDSEAETEALACVDVSTVDVIDSAGTSVVPSDRPDRYAVQLSFQLAEVTRTGLVLSKSTAVQDERCGG